MRLTSFNVSINRSNDYLLNNSNPDDLDLINNKNSINNNCLESFEPNNIFSISEEDGLNDKKNNYGIKLARIINGYKTKRYFKTRIEKDIPKPLFEKEISILIKKMSISKETKEKFISCINKISNKKEEIKNKLALNPSERRKTLNCKIKNEDKFKKGRKSKNDISVRSHNRFSFDNMIDKIKNIINTSLVLFCNRVIKTIYGDKTQIKQIFYDAKIPKKISTTKIIKDIDKSFILNKKKGNEILELLNMTVKEYLSNKISSKYANIPHEYNKLIIKQLLSDENNKDIFEFLFNILEIGDFFNILIYQKKFKDILYYEQLNEYQKKVLKNNYVSISDYLKKIYIKDEYYFQCLVILIYNFRRYLMIKERRNRFEN